MSLAAKSNPALRACIRPTLGLNRVPTRRPSIIANRPRLPAISHTMGIPEAMAVRGRQQRVYMPPLENLLPFPFRPFSSISGIVQFPILLGLGVNMGSSLPEALNIREV